MIRGVHLQATPILLFHIREASSMIPAIIIAKKRDGLELDTQEIDFMISGYSQGSIPDYQMSALAMAILLQGMNPREIADLTDAMIRSGGSLERVSDRPRVDKHSTGGLGDKTSLILAPLLACCDLDVPMISGRGLGITGGTLDKLEAIHGFRCDLTEREAAAVLGQVHCFITGATQRLVPADKKLYALRDVTGTVPSIALITASIMSKKIAETLDALVLDVKCGSGAFLATPDRAEALARSLISIGQRAGVATAALVTDMNQPLGRMVGNACEVDESIDVLRGSGPREVRELTLELCARLLMMTQRTQNRGEALRILEDHLDSGRAMARFEAMVHLQGGDLAANRSVGTSRPWLAPQRGRINRMDGQKIGEAIIAMGGGRTYHGQAIDHSVGLCFERRLGDSVERGELIVRILCDDAQKSEQAGRLLTEAIAIEESGPSERELSRQEPERRLWRDYPEPWLPSR
jgi:pyrimidine-nucleoside phosphorylase